MLNEPGLADSCRAEAPSAAGGQGCSGSRSAGTGRSARRACRSSRERDSPRAPDRTDTPRRNRGARRRPFRSPTDRRSRRRACGPRSLARPIAMSSATISASARSRLPCSSSKRATMRSSWRHRSTVGRQMFQRSGRGRDRAVDPSEADDNELHLTSIKDLITSLIYTNHPRAGMRAHRKNLRIRRLPPWHIARALVRSERCDWQACGAAGVARQGRHAGRRERRCEAYSRIDSMITIDGSTAKGAGRSSGRRWRCRSRPATPFRDREHSCAASEAGTAAAAPHRRPGCDRCRRCAGRGRRHRIDATLTFVPRACAQANYALPSARPAARRSCCRRCCRRCCSRG